MEAFDEILGQPTAVHTLRQGIATGRVHHAYRFEGPEGVGKERTALAFAQTLLCQVGKGCGECSPCRRVRTFTEQPPTVPLHPDLLLLGRGIYSGTLITAKETNGISVEQIRKIVLGRVGFPPHEGKALVVIIRDAEELTTSAANALLKTLEEPKPRVHFVLLSSRPNRLLDTVRSRTLAVRFGPLPDDVVRGILKEHGQDEALYKLARGSAKAALELGSGGEHEAIEAFATALDAAVQAPTLIDGLDFAGDLPRDKHVLRARLTQYSDLLAAKNRDLVKTLPDAARRMTERYDAVQRALDGIEKNAAPALSVEAMLVEMRRSEGRV